MTERTVTLIIPAARDSADGRPTWLRVHPLTSEILLISILRALDLTRVRRVLLVVKQDHIDRFFEGRKGDLEDYVMAEGTRLPPSTVSFEVVILQSETSSGPETVLRAIQQQGVEGPIFVKDSDGSFDHQIDAGNYVVGYKVTGSPDELIHSLPQKSFLGATGHVLTVIQEKQMISDIISVGGYAFESAAQFAAAYAAVTKIHHDAELCLRGVSGHAVPRMFLSHIVQSMMLSNNSVFGVSYCSGFDDWKSEAAWRSFLARFQNVVLQLEGVLVTAVEGTSIVKLAGGAVEAFSPVTQNIAYVRNLFKAGHSRIVIASSRPEAQRRSVERLLESYGVPYHVLLLGQMGSTTFVVSSYGNGQPHPSSVSYCLPSGASQLGSILHL
jgi:hypothetical protein